MSHFTVAIISDGKTPINEYLEPYCECTEDPKFLEFVNVEDTHRTEYETETRRVVDMGDGSYRELYDEFFLVPTTEEFYNEHANNDNIRVWRRYENGVETYYFSDYSQYNIVEEKVNVIYKTIGEYLETLGYSKNEQEGAYGFWCNPNSKWDWYVVGGRWKGMLRARCGEHGVNPLFETAANVEGRYDIAQIKDIDFSPDVAAHRHATRFWEVYVEGGELLEDESASEYRSYMKPEYYIEQFGNKERFARAQSELSTFAVITNDGEWHEQGEMGWFGVCHASGEQVQKWYDTWYDAFIKDTNPEWYVAIIDCHI